MARLKFLVYALLVLALWTAHLVLLTPPMVRSSVDLAMAHAQAARPLAQAEISARRQLLQRVATKLAAQPKLAATALALRAPSPKEAVPADKLQDLKAMVEEQAPEGLKGSLVFGYITEGGGTFFRGGQPAAEGLDAALGKAGQDGLVQEAFGVSHLFVSLPVWDRSLEPKQVGTIVLGAPLLTDGMMDAVAKDAALAAAGIFQGGRLVQGGGAEKAALERVGKLAQPGQGTVVERGSTSSLGPFKLPLFTAADDRGGSRAPLLIASRQAIEDTPYELIAVTSVKSLMSALGGYQQFALGVLGGLLVLTLAWAALMGSGPAEEREASETSEEGQEAPADRSMETQSEPSREEEAPPGERAPEMQLGATMPDPTEEHGDPRLERAIAQLGATHEDPGLAPYEPSPEPATTADPEPAYGGYEAAPPPEDPFSQYQSPAMPDSEGTFRSESPFASAGQELGASEPEATPASMPMAMAPIPVSNPSISKPMLEDSLPRFSSDPSEPPGLPDDNPDATRVATIPQELLEASARTTARYPAPAARQSGTLSLPKMPAVAAATHANPEEAHFQDVYREFVATRERCGEGADGLTYDKFVAKLRKNKEQLVQKYACKTVRFQVYVKEGKAALKATPVKE